LFRLVLQGWLEKWEDTELGWRIPPVPVPTEIEPGDTVATVTETGVTIEAQPVEVAPALLIPPERGVGGLPYGWFPIGSVRCC
jgi:hypothetical protein